MEGRYSNRDFTSIDLEEKRSQSLDDDKTEGLSVERQASGSLLENEKITFSWSNLSVSLQRNNKRYFRPHLFFFYFYFIFPISG